MPGIPYYAFPSIDIGPLSIKTFGLFVALGIVVGIMVASRRNERFNIPRSETERVGMILVGIGLVGARVAWVATHWNELASPLEAFAVWKGGLQFTGGFIAAIMLAPLLTRRWPPGQRWELLDGACIGLAIGQAIGRLGCVAVGEHLGGPTNFFLGMHYLGGPTVEGPLTVGVTYHSTAIYEILWLIPIIGLMLWLDRRNARAGTIAAVFAMGYGLCRFGTDFLRTYDERVFGLTGAQYGSIALFVFGLGLLFFTRRAAAKLALEVPEVDESGDEGTDVADTAETADDDAPGDEATPEQVDPGDRPVTTHEGA